MSRALGHSRFEASVVGDLGPFRLISPCGRSPEVMTRLADLGVLAEGASWRRALERGMVAPMARAAGREDCRRTAPLGGAR